MNGRIGEPKGAVMENVNDPVAPAYAPVPPLMVAVPESVPAEEVAAASADSVAVASPNKNSKLIEVVLPVGTPVT